MCATFVYMIICSAVDCYVNDNVYSVMVGLIIGGAMCVLSLLSIPA